MIERSLSGLRQRLRWRGVACCLASLFCAATLAQPDGASLEGTATSTEESESLTNTLGSWIWTDTVTNDQVCLFWRSFEVPPSTHVRTARVEMTADNEFIFYLDGRAMGRGAEWRELYDFDLTPLLSPGKHILAIRTRNSFSFAGMLFGLRVDLSDGRILRVKSDASWRIVPEDTPRWETAQHASPAWPKATIVEPFGSDPWSEMPVNVNMMPVLQPIKVLFWQTGWFQITLLSVCAAVILFSIWLVMQLALHRKERVLLQRERARIARDIHDDLGSRMTQLVLHGEVMQSELDRDSSTRPQLDRICHEARDVLSTLDEILWAVNPRRDTLTDFSSYVCSYAEEFLKPAFIQCFFDVDSDVSSVGLDLPARRTLLMVIKEALNNVVKYSGATELQLRIKQRGRKLLVTLQDNGKGFDVAAERQSGNGLANMTERMKELGGTCTITSRPGQGCRIEFSLGVRPVRRRTLGRLVTAKPVSALLHETKET